MLSYIVEANNFLRKNIKAYSTCKYRRVSNDGQKYFDQNVSDAVRTLKNTFENEDDSKLNRARNYIKTIATTDIEKIIAQEHLFGNIAVVCVPRSKATFSRKQQLFRDAINAAANTLNVENLALSIDRHTNTLTTHLKNSTDYNGNNLGGDGDAPYPGITNDTCNFYGNVRGKTVILVDDIYTKSVNIDEDCADFLLSNGAANVLLYTLCKTELD